MPPYEFVPFGRNPLANLSQFLLPAAIMGLSTAGFTMRMTRAMMLEVLRQDYIRTAWAKGIRERAVIYRHALKNGLIPVVTIIGVQTAHLIGGSAIMESIFALPGMGRLVLSAMSLRDYPMLQATNLVFAGAILLLNLMVDLSYGWLDPRIRYQ